MLEKNDENGGDLKKNQDGVECKFVTKQNGGRLFQKKIDILNFLKEIYET